MLMWLADEVANVLSRTQAGAFARWQLLARGVSDSAIKQRTGSGRWVRKVPGVYANAAVGSSYDQRLWVAWLACGPTATISHEAAAELHGLPNVVRGLVTLTVDHSGQQRIPDAFVHQISDVQTHHRTSVRGLPVTTIPRTIVDLGAVVGPVRLQHIVESAEHGRHASYLDIGECLLEVARRGKPGVQALSRVLRLLTDTGGLDQSVLERALLLLLKRHHLPPPIPQMAHPGRALPTSCVDCGYPEGQLIIEADGRAWHSRIADLRLDHERDAEAARAGWLTLRLFYEHIVDDPDGTATTIRDVLTTRAAQLAS
ncbi:MAG: DUF559 domain-containing protein [Acidimicrobiales bacterium]